MRAIFKTCKLDWHYRVPPDAAGRAHLRALCEETLAFENHAMAQCRRTFTQIAQAGDPGQQTEARARLRRLTAAEGDEPGPP